MENEGLSAEQFLSASLPDASQFLAPRSDSLISEESAFPHTFKSLLPVLPPPLVPFASLLCPAAPPDDEFGSVQPQAHGS